MAERIDILQELGLTPVWRLRARYRSDGGSIAPHAVKEPPHAVTEPPHTVNKASQADAVSESPHR
ncbi:MAG TPA: hypothetical protein VGT81_10030, partial [Casimicrobiaceae bacterium]|nr:hypothetical protein [Casimicrobiaceae bacterium]